MAQAVQPQASADACTLSPASGYRGPENQLYRVEIHTGNMPDSTGAASTTKPTFKWSRDDGSVTAPITGIGGPVVSVTTLGRDPKLSIGDRGVYKRFYTDHKQAIIFACVRCANAEAAPLGVQGSIAAIGQFLGSLAGDLMLKIIHDYYNARGVRVRNALGQEWTTFGDAHLGGHAETIAMASLASKASRDAVEDVLATGGTQRADAAKVGEIPEDFRRWLGSLEQGLREGAASDPFNDLR